MRVVFLSAGPDTAGCGIALKRAFDQHAPDWDARAICRQPTYLDYPVDVLWLPKGDRRTHWLALELIDEADVVHVLDHQQPLGWAWLKGKAIVMHHLGSRFRSDPVESSARCREVGATEVTDSIDLLYPGVSYLPIPAELDALAAIRGEHYQPSNRLRIAHAPTNRDLKHTDLVLEVVQSLAASYPIDFDLIEGVSNRECLARKAAADIFVDQLLFGFGLNAIECWAMGIPVVSGLVRRAARKKALATWGGYPWADATEETLETVLEGLVTDRRARRELGERGRTHVHRWHSQRSVVEQTLAVYERAKARLAA